MKQLLKEHKGLNYSFEFMELSNVIVVVKSDVPTYNIRIYSTLKGQLEFYCNCPGAVYHQKCWHTEIVPELLAMPSINEPWTEWAEDAAKIQYGR